VIGPCDSVAREREELAALYPEKMCSLIGGNKRFRRHKHLERP
jgi:hypothetical protein